MAKMTDEHKAMLQAARAKPKTLKEHLQTLIDNGVGGTMFEQAKRNLENMGASTRKIYVKCIIGTASPRERIKCFCYECMGWDKYEVADCTSLGCPLYLKRPVLKRKAASTQS